MPEENELKVEIEQEAPPIQEAVRPDETSADTESAAVSDFSKQFEDMKARSEADASARRAAEARAAQLERVAHQARSEAVGTRLQGITAQLAAAESEGNAAEEAYARAMDQGNFAEAAKAQRRMSRAEADVSRLSAYKSDMEAAGGGRAAPNEAPQYAPPPSDPVEVYIQGKTAPTADWLRSHRDWVTDSSKNAKLQAAHWDAVSKHIALDTPEYFEAVEKYIGLRQAPVPEQRRKPAMPPVASPTNGRMGAVSGDTVYLTKREAENAEDGTIVWNYDDPSPQKRFRKGDPIGRKEFARRKREMLQQGLYDKSYEQG